MDPKIDEAAVRGWLGSLLDAGDLVDPEALKVALETYKGEVSESLLAAASVAAHLLDRALVMQQETENKLAVAQGRIRALEQELEDLAQRRGPRFGSSQRLGESNRTGSLRPVSLRESTDRIKTFLAQLTSGEAGPQGP